MNALFVCAALAAAAPAPVTPAAPALDEKPWEARVSSEDALAAFQWLSGLGAAATVGALVLVPVNIVIGTTVLVGYFAENPWLMVAPPLFLLAGVALVQAVAAGAAVWGVSLVGNQFRARSWLPATIATLMRERLKADPDRPLVRRTLGVPWLAPVGGALGGALLGGAFGLAVALPALAAAFVISRPPADATAGMYALAAAAGLGAVALVVAQAVLIPLGAVLAHHLTKEAQG